MRFPFRSTRSGVALLLGAALVLGAAGTASAHAIAVTKVYTTPVEEGYSTIAYTSPVSHGGRVTFTYFKKNASDDWVQIGDPRPGNKITDGVWSASLAEQPGDRSCKVRAKYTARDHTPATGVDRFAC